MMRRRRNLMQSPMLERSLPACETKQLGMGFFNAFVEYSELAETC